MSLVARSSAQPTTAAATHNQTANSLQPPARPSAATAAAA